MGTAVLVPRCVVLVARGEKELLQVGRLTPSCLSHSLCLSCMTKNMANNRGFVPVLSSPQSDLHRDNHNNPFNVNFLLRCIVFSWFLMIV